MFLQGLLADGRLRVVEDGAAGPVTLHDSCYLTRYNGVVEAPRTSSDRFRGWSCWRWSAQGKTFCCGAGGGRMWMEETRGTRINAERTRQALETGAATVVTECPFCMTMLKDGLADAQSTAGGTVSATDISEVLAGSLAPVQPGGRRPCRCSSRAQVVQGRAAAAPVSAPWTGGATAETLVAHAAISARRVTPSFLRMCSMCALAVFGAIWSSRAISAFVSPLATRRATSNSRAVSGRHGSSR